MYVSYEISIHDSGIGITPENLKKLFIDFGKLEDIEGRNKSGTGLGLSISKKIIEQMGGKVSVSSKVGVGTQFKIRLNTKCKVIGTTFYD
jgi:signal transduction histidine kinase